jgi:hypothetical protein
MNVLFNIRDAVAKWLGIAAIIFGALCVAAGVDISSDPESRRVGMGILGFCVPVLIVPGILLLYFGLRAERERLGYEKLAAFLKAYRRIKIPTLATKLGISEFETERRILRCVRLGLLSGYMDRGSDEFFNPYGMEGKMLVTCPHCGGPVEQLVLEGETGKCPFCGSLLQSKAGR